MIARTFALIVSGGQVAYISLHATFLYNPDILHNNYQQWNLLVIHRVLLHIPVSLHDSTQFSPVR